VASHSSCSGCDPHWGALSPLRTLTQYRGAFLSHCCCESRRRRRESVEDRRRLTEWRATRVAAGATHIGSRSHRFGLSRSIVSRSFRAAVARVGAAATSASPECARGLRSCRTLRAAPVLPTTSAHDTPGPAATPDAPSASRILRRWGRSPGALRARGVPCVHHPTIPSPTRRSSSSAPSPCVRRSRRPSRSSGSCCAAARLGVWFRRHVPLGRFAADFVAQSVRLVVEVDGGYHARRLASDAHRDRAPLRLGYRVLRLEARRSCSSDRSRPLSACAPRSTGTEPRGARLTSPVRAPRRARTGARSARSATRTNWGEVGALRDAHELGRGRRAPRRGGIQSAQARSATRTNSREIGERCETGGHLKRAGALLAEHRRAPIGGGRRALRDGWAAFIGHICGARGDASVRSGAR
jgi:hypothetical protein